MKRFPILSLLAVALLSGRAPAQEPDPRAPDPGLMKLMAEAKVDASRIRGLPFLSDLPARRITKEEFLEISRRDVERVFGTGEALVAMEELLHALGVVPEGKGLLRIMEEFFPATVAAKYDPFEREILFLRGFGSKSIMVHELVHALEDQHYNLRLLFEQGEMTFDRLLALGALAEGDAENVQRTFDTNGMLAMTPLPFIRSLGEQQVEQYLTRMKDFPRALARPFIFQYLDGLLFVETVKRARGGFAGLDAVYRDPPATTEQILHPERYLERDRPTAILPPAPPEGWQVRVANSLGEMGVRIALAERTDPAVAVAAAAGWDGDRIVLLRDGGGRSVLAWYTTWDTPEDAAEFGAAAETMIAGRHGGAAFGGEPALRVAREGDVAHAVVRAGRDVLLAEGLPGEGTAAFLNAILGGEKVELREVRDLFGAGMAPQTK